ncbi:MAG: hypothetical protein AAB401_04135, partial [Acidobacteriota bacterium]
MKLLKQLLMILPLAVACPAHAHILPPSFSSLQAIPISENRDVVFSDEAGLRIGDFISEPVESHREETMIPAIIVLDHAYRFMGAYGVRAIDDNLYLTRHRAYDAELMRFLQNDPQGIKGG